MGGDLSDRGEPIEWPTADLAPGDGKSAGLDVGRLDLQVVRSATAPGFDEAYRALWEEFGPSGEMETAAVIAARLGPASMVREDGWTLYYQLLTVRDGMGRAAVRDHSVLIPPDGAGGQPRMAVVHLSHLLVAPRWRRTGLAGWMRALPLQTARVCLRGRPVPVTLVAEMEPVLTGQPERQSRMLAYGRAGFRLVDPDAVRYYQPDFRPTAAIVATGGAEPVPMMLLVRRVGREGEIVIDGAEVRMIVEALYRLYAEGCRPEDIASLRKKVQENYPAPSEPVCLLELGECVSR